MAGSTQKSSISWVRIALSAALTIFFLLHASLNVDLIFIKKLENLIYDTRLKMTVTNDLEEPVVVDDRIIIIDIDEKSLAKEGRWPWPRDRMAQLVDTLFDDYKVALLVMDVVWAEPDDSSGLKTLEKLAKEELADNVAFQTTLDRIRPDLMRDQIFARSIKNRPVVLGYYFDTGAKANEGLTSGSLPQPTFIKQDFLGRTVKTISATGYGANLAMFQEVAVDAGHFNPDPDLDGIIRQIPMLIKYKDQYYGSLSLAVFQQLKANAKLKPGFAEGSELIRRYNGMEWLELGGYVIPVDEKMNTLVPYRGGKGSFLYISASDVLNKTVDASKLKGTVALLGTSAPGLNDLRSTPLQTSYPGVELHANMIAGFIDQDFKQNPAWSLGAEFTLLLIIGVALGLTLPIVSPVVATLITLVSAFLVSLLNYYLWSDANIALPLASTLLLIAGLYIINTSYGYFVVSRGKRQLAGLFGQYIPSELVDEMNETLVDFSLKGDSRNMTVMFSDVRDFTSISESLEPAELQQLMNEFLTPITRVIHHNRGTIDKYMGDAVMAFWNAPLKDEAHASHALHSALEIITELEKLQPVFLSKGWPALRLGIGLNTGVMRVGDMGSEFRKAYTVMGDAVNLGSRLEGLTKQYGVMIIVSQSTKDAVKDIIYRELDRVRVKGKDKPVTIYEPIATQGDGLTTEVKNELGIYKQALAYYRDMNWDLAEMQFLNLIKLSPESKLYMTYAERIRIFRQTPPAHDWDGVYTFETK